MSAPVAPRTGSKRSAMCEGSSQGLLPSTVSRGRLWGLGAEQLLAPMSAAVTLVRVRQPCTGTFQALVYEHPGQELEIELFDEDPDKNDFLGR